MFTYILWKAFVKTFYSSINETTIILGLSFIIGNWMQVRYIQQGPNRRSIASLTIVLLQKKYTSGFQIGDECPYASKFIINWAD